MPPRSSPLRASAVAALLTALATLTVLVSPTQPAAAQEPTRDTEAVIAQRFADERVRAGVAAVPRSGQLDGVARDWARRQAADGQMGHNPNLRDEVQPARAWYENVGHLRGVPSSMSHRDAGARLHEMWMASDGHRANILRDPLTDVGIGVASSGDAIYVAVVFRWQGGSADPTPAPSPTSSPEEDASASASSAAAPPSPRPSPRAATPEPAAPTEPAGPAPPATPAAAAPAPAPEVEDPDGAAGLAAGPGERAHDLDRRLGTDHAARPAELSADPGAGGAGRERPPVELQVLPDAAVAIPRGGEGRLAVPLVLGSSAVAAVVVAGGSRARRRGR